MANTAELRALWKKYECAPEHMPKIDFMGDQIRVAEPTLESWSALEAVLKAHSYKVRTGDTDSYVCRKITGGAELSLHSYGIALDINWNTNPYKDHDGNREVIFSDKDTQERRAQDVKNSIADTDMTAGMIADALAIKTKQGKRIFEWGGTWNGVKDCMHFELDLGPIDLDAGVDWTTVEGTPDVQGPVGIHIGKDLGKGASDFVVIARNGLRMRSGPGVEFDVLQLLPEGTKVSGIRTDGPWVMVSVNSDALADGYVFGSFLQAAAHNLVHSKTIDANAKSADLTPEQVATLYDSSAKSNVNKHWPAVKTALDELKIYDKSMIAMALGTIAAETAGFVPIDEFKSKYNTKNYPFDLYEPGTSAGIKLGNNKAGDGALFKGRGFVQLTGRYNYTHIGLQINTDLVVDPVKANESEIAAKILARFLKNKETKIRDQLELGTLEGLKAARKLVNGGHHGFDRFKNVYEDALQLLA